MITITDYTSYNEVRATLGVSEFEITDATLAMPLYASALQRELRGTIDSTGKSLYTYFDDLSAEETLTDAEDTLFGLIKEFSTYIVAESCLTGISLQAMKTESDGKAVQTRFSAESTFLSVSNNIRNKLSVIRNDILTAIGMTTTYVPVNYLNRVAPAVDVVTE